MPADMTRTYEPDPSSCAHVRRDVIGFLTATRVREHVIDAAVTVANELAGNAVDHAHTPFRLFTSLTSHHLRIEVTDGSTASPHLQPIDPRALRGRGLQMVDHLTTAWTCHVDRAGKTVVADIAVGSGGPRRHTEA